MSGQPDSQAAALTLAPPPGINRRGSVGPYRFAAWGAPRWLFLLRLLLVAVLVLVFSPISRVPSPAVWTPSPPGSSSGPTPSWCS
jgi:hypothetical protein